MPKCTHKHLRYTCTEWEDGYRQPENDAIQAALRVPKQGSTNKGKDTISADQPQPAIPFITERTFPAPLVEEDDELYHDPNYPPQSVQDCLRARNAVTPPRRTVYVVPPPQIEETVADVRGWTLPQIPAPPLKRKTAARDTAAKGTEGENAGVPQVEDLAEYLQAFYHGLPVKVLDGARLRFCRWDGGENAPGRRTARIGLATSRQVFGVRHRPSKDGVFAGQLNLDDVLDTAMAILPEDAYALLMLVHHDLYEDEDDDFCCGRAYGGSRISVVSTARYRPELDRQHGVNREHSWPASHCVKASETSKVAHGEEKSSRKGSASSAIRCAVDAFTSLSSPTTAEELATLWLGRVCKTASHELGHCFGMDHCTYFACIMQGTASVAEDARQPPYLCPVDLVKVLTATGASETEHCTALLGFCERRAADKLFAALAAWLSTRLRQLRGRT